MLGAHGSEFLGFQPTGRDVVVLVEDVVLVVDVVS